MAFDCIAWRDTGPPLNGGGSSLPAGVFGHSALAFGGGGAGSTGFTSHPQSPSVFMKMATPELDAGSCWYDHDMSNTLGVADIFSEDPSKY
jgi:hypothetical protein